MIRTLEQTDALIGFGKPASKAADWIVNTHIPNAPVSYRLSIENVIADAIVEAAHSVPHGYPIPVASVPVSVLVDLENELRREAIRAANAMNALCGGKGYSEKAATLAECADRLSDVIRGTKT